MLWHRLRAVAILLATSATGYFMWRWASQYASPLAEEPHEFLLPALVCGAVGLAFIGWIFGVGGIVASFGAVSDGKGYFKYRNNWVARWFMPKLRPDATWCTVSAGASSKFLDKILGVVVILGASVLLWEFAVSEPWPFVLMACAFASVIVAFLGLFIAVEEKWPVMLLVPVGVLIGWVVYGATFVPWGNVFQDLYQYATTAIGAMPTIALHPITLAVVSVVLLVLAVVLLLRNDAVHATVCPTLRPQAVDPPKTTASASAQPSAHQSEQSASS